MKKQKESKINPKVSPYKFDDTLTYIIPMKKFEDRLRHDVEPEPIECKVKLKDRVVMVDHPEYKHYIFSDYNFDWYLYTGHIKIKESKGN